MIYLYTCPSCNTDEEIIKPMREAARQERCGKCGCELTRNFQAEGACGATAALKTDIRKYPYVSSRLPKNLAGCDCDKYGKPVITSKSHEREVMARHNLRRD